MKDTRIAAVISNSRVGETRKNLEQMGRWINKAAAQGNKAAGYDLLKVQGTGEGIHTYPGLVIALWKYGGERISGESGHESAVLVHAVDHWVEKVAHNCGQHFSAVPA